MRNLTVNPEMVSLARKSRGKTQAQLAEDVGISQATISKCEAGVTALTSDDLFKIANGLDYPEHFFAQRPNVEGPGISELFHRKRQRASASILSRAYAMAEIRRLEVRKLLESSSPPDPEVPKFPIDEFESDPEKIARTVRAVWKMPRGPIFNVTRALERGGCLVMAHDFGTRLIDGFSHRSVDMPPIFHLNKNLPPDRWRWTLAHELGHVVMHFEPQVSPTLMEQQADRFAGEFLAPGNELKPMLWGLSFQKLAGLKREWKISMQALVMRAYHLGAITERQRRSMFTRISKAGYRLREPENLDPPYEPPERAFNLVRLHLTVLEFTRSELKDLLAIGETDFVLYYHDPHDVLQGF